MTMPLAANPEQVWLDRVRELMLHGDDARAAQAIALGLREYPRSFELRRMLAGVHRRGGREGDAESMLRQLLAERGDDAGSAFTLARMLVGQCRSGAAAAVMRDFSLHAAHDPELAIQAIELLDGCDRKSDAAAIAVQAVDATPDDPRLHAYAGMLAAQLGEFGRARFHYSYALDHAEGACEWHVPYGLASLQRYADSTHPDFARFRECAARDDLSGKARSSLLFALAKAHDDIGEFAAAARYSREANAIAQALTSWSRKQWRRGVQARLDANPIGSAAQMRLDFVPVFVMGVPRSGTTLASTLLSRHPGVCNRGESPWLAKLAQQPELIGNPAPTALERAADRYVAQLQQDDAAAMHWFIDKQPLNFRYVDLALALFPNARIIYCRRGARDTALSLWLQSFHEDVQGYAYDFANIALVMHDCERLMARWCATHTGAIRTLCYEKLVATPDTVMADLADWIGLPSRDLDATPAATPAGIATASLWQARQPVYATSVGRWKNYVTLLPELLRFAPEPAALANGQCPSDRNSM